MKAKISLQSGSSRYSRPRRLGPRRAADVVVTLFVWADEELLNGVDDDVVDDKAAR